MRSYLFPGCFLGVPKGSLKFAPKAAIGYSQPFWATPFSLMLDFLLVACCPCCHERTFAVSCWVSRELDPDLCATPQHSLAQSLPEFPVTISPPSPAGQGPDGNHVPLSRYFSLRVPVPKEQKWVQTSLPCRPKCKGFHICQHVLWKVAHHQPASSQI